MRLQLTTFPAKSVEQYDKVYMVRGCVLHSVLDVRHSDEATAIILDGGNELVLKGLVEPEHMIVLIKEI